MQKLSIPDSWGVLDNTAQVLFGYGRDKVLALLSDVARRINWSGAHVHDMAYAVGWIAGRLLAIEEERRTQRYPGTARSSAAAVESVASDYISDVERVISIFGLKNNGVAVSQQTKAYFPLTAAAATADLSTQLDSCLHDELHIRPALTAIFLLFRDACDPNLVYTSFVDGLVAAYSPFLSREGEFKNDVIHFIHTEIRPAPVHDLFINHYIFESENTGLLISAKLFVNPVLGCASMRLINEDDASQIAVVSVENRRNLAYRRFSGQEEDIMRAGRLLLDRVVKTRDERLAKALRDQASKSIVAVVADDLARLAQDVFDKPFAEDVIRLREFEPVSLNYRNFEAPQGYNDLIDRMKKLLSASEMSDEFFAEISRIAMLLRDMSQTAINRDKSPD